MVSAYSKVPDVAADLVKYLDSADAQKKRAIDLSLLPTLVDLQQIGLRSSPAEAHRFAALTTSEPDHVKVRL